MVLGQDSESSYRVAVDLQQRQGHTRFAVGTGPNHDAGNTKKRCQSCDCCCHLSSIDLERQEACGHMCTVWLSLLRWMARSYSLDFCSARATPHGSKICITGTAVEVWSQKSYKWSMPRELR